MVVSDEYVGHTWSTNSATAADSKHSFIGLWMAPANIFQRIISNGSLADGSGALERGEMKTQRI